MLRNSKPNSNLIEIAKYIYSIEGTQRKAAKRLNISQSTFSRWLSGVIPQVGMKRARKISELYGISMAKIIPELKEFLEY
jgi:transcriptional regulator with XRE-family HTH domain